jgi:cobalamin biosynthesis Mg chelatase CobN
MHRRSVIRVVATATALCAPLALSSVADGGVPAVKLDNVRETVGQTVARTGASLPQKPRTPVTRAPAARPSPARPSPRPASAPQQAPARATAPAAPVHGNAGNAAPAARASAPKARSSAKASAAKASGGGKAAADPTDAVSADTGSAQTPTASSSAGDADAGSLPFTGSTILPVFLVAVLLLLTGVVLRRTVRPRT